MFRCLLATVFGLGAAVLLYLYLFNYQPLLFNSILAQTIHLGVKNILPAKKKVVIYGATTYFGEPMWSEIILDHACPKEVAEYCEYTRDPAKKMTADAWIYHNRDFTPELMENRSTTAVHVMHTMESPTSEKMKALYPPNTINWTMTYKRDSDFFMPYGIVTKNGTAASYNGTGFDFIWDMKSPNVTATWMLSHCITPNRREDLALKARDSGLQLDIYGKCHNGTNLPPCPGYSNGWVLGACETLKKYYFYLSFENSNCVDYVTEKFYNAWQLYYAIPIVIKRQYYTNMGFPPKSFIALDDFSSIQEMVNFLNNLKANKTEYLSYHEWRKEYNVKRIQYPVGLCSLCERLRYPILQRKTYPDMKAWYTGDGHCDDNYADKYL